MLSKEAIIEAARNNGFRDVGFTTAEPFESHKAFLAKRQDKYGWIEKSGYSLLAGTDPQSILPGAKTIIVMLEEYFQKSFPLALESHFGRCYLDDDRVTRVGLYKRVKAFRGLLRDNGIDSKVPPHLPHRMSAARAGLGTFGKNGLFFSRRLSGKSSFVLPIAVVIDHKFEADEPTLEMGCPDWCRNVCIAACPTRALLGNAALDPRKCISYLSYYGNGLTPKELREPMGLYVYGCDRCQNVCPRNAACLAAEKPINENAQAKLKDFSLSKLLAMDTDYYKEKIWPHMFYMPAKDIWRWKMNVARVMGNSGDRAYTRDLITAFETEADWRVKAMAAWALGRLGSAAAIEALNNFAEKSDGIVAEEVADALTTAAKV
jgi:epoxyqueuosine reductase